MHTVMVFENSCTDRAKEHYIYYFCDGEYFIITRDSKDGYRENKTVLMPNLCSVLDFIANLVDDGNKVEIEAGDDREEFHTILDVERFMYLYRKSKNAEINALCNVGDIDITINMCRYR